MARFSKAEGKQLLYLKGIIELIKVLDEPERQQLQKELQAVIDAWIAKKDVKISEP